MKTNLKSGTVWLATIVLVAGCQSEGTDPVGDQAVLRSQFELRAEPATGEGVRSIRDSARDGDHVVVIGRIGGMDNPWVAGIAAFSIVDPALKPCNELGDDACPKPWDYC